jgi:hypothetical protein
MASVFVSYAHEDVSQARAITQALEDASFDVWFDERLHSGCEFSREIEQALANASAIVVLWSKASVNSNWVRDEAAEGRDSGRLVPVLLDDVRPPIGFRQIHATNLANLSGREWARQIDGVIKALCAKSAAFPNSPQVPTAVPRRRRRFPLGWIGAALAVGLIAIASFILIGRMNSGPKTVLTVALTPFDAEASNSEARRMASAAHDAVAHSLSQSPFALKLIDSVAKASSERPTL